MKTYYAVNTSFRKDFILVCSLGFNVGFVLALLFI